MAPTECPKLHISASQCAKCGTAKGIGKRGGRISVGGVESHWGCCPFPKACPGESSHPPPIDEGEGARGKEAFWLRQTPPSHLPPALAGNELMITSQGGLPSEPLPPPPLAPRHPTSGPLMGHVACPWEMDSILPATRILGQSRISRFGGAYRFTNSRGNWRKLKPLAACAFAIYPLCKLPCITGFDYKANNLAKYFLPSPNLCNIPTFPKIAEVTLMDMVTA